MSIFDRFKKNKNLILYTEKELDIYEKFISENFGKYDKVLHEIVSPDIHLDVIVVPPTKKDNYYKLITMGMGAYKMNVPSEIKSYELERAELVLYLPPTWDINSTKEEDYWPIKQLKVLGRLPLNYNTWLGHGHTISSSENNSEYASNTKFCAIMLFKALGVDFQKLDLRIDKLGKINFYHLYPIYLEELNYKMEHSANELLDLIDDNDIMPILNINRKNYGINKK